MVEAVLLCSSSKCGETEDILEWQKKVVLEGCGPPVGEGGREGAYLGSGIMMGSSSSSSLCCTRSGSSHTRLWSLSIMSRSNWNSLGMDGWDESRSACCRAWLLEDNHGHQLITEVTHYHRHLLQMHRRKTLMALDRKSEGRGRHRDDHCWFHQ